MPAKAGVDVPPSVDLRVTDRFGRDVSRRGLTLVDWQGYMANPAIVVTIGPPRDAVGPVQVKVEASEPRLAFDLPSQAGPNGPSKSFMVTAERSGTFDVSLFPARKKKSFETSIRVRVIDARHREWTVSIPLHVTHAADDPVHAAPSYPVIVDFSQDRTGFFNDRRRDAFTRAANDWAYYLADVRLRTVIAGAEQTPIFPPTALTGDHREANRNGYTGFLLYAYGIHTAALRSSGQPSDGGFQSTEEGRRLPLRRSGGVEAEVQGNYNQLGWSDVDDDNWFRATNAAGTPHDFYSIMHHEIGHAIIFDAWYSGFRKSGVLTDASVVAYLRARPRTDGQNHLPGVVDPTSLRGAFGNEYGGRMPLGRWLITKTDLLVAQSVGYSLRPVDALQPLAIERSKLPDGRVGTAYRALVHGTGGVPSYDWTLETGSLPAGLVLDRFTGEITGTPVRSGQSGFKLRLRDNAPGDAVVTAPLTLRVF